MKEILLTKGMVALVDDDDYEELVKHHWCAQNSRGIFYATRRPRSGKLWMHRVIMKAPTSVHIDDQNRNGLDNRKLNLRFASRTQNQANKRIKETPKTSRFKGVHWSTKSKAWRAQIQKDGKFRHLGFHDSEADAALAYDMAATQYFGEFARANFSV